MVEHDIISMNLSEFNQSRLNTSEIMTGRELRRERRKQKKIKKKMKKL